MLPEPDNFPQLCYRASAFANQHALTTSLLLWPTWQVDIHEYRRELAHLAVFMIFSKCLITKKKKNQQKYNSLHEFSCPDILQIDKR